MLPVLHAAPTAAPTEASRGEGFLAKVVIVNLMREVAAAVDELHRCRRADARPLHTWVLQRVDVDGHAEGVARELPTALDGAVVETRGVVGLHRSLVGSTEVVHQTDATDGVTLRKQGSENLQQITGNGLVAHHLAHSDLAVEVIIRQGEIAQLREGDLGGVGERLAEHPLLDFTRNGLRNKHIATMHQRVAHLGKRTFR